MPSTAIALGFAAVLIAQLGLLEPAWTAFAVAIGLALAVTVAEVRLSPPVPAISLGLLPALAAMVHELPPAVCFGAGLLLVLEDRFARSGPARRRDWPLWVVINLAGITAAYVAYSGLSEVPIWGALPAGVVAATVFYLVRSGGEAAHRKFSEGKRFAAGWRNRFLRSLPACVLSVAGLAVVSLLVFGTTVIERLFGVILVLAGLAYLGRRRALESSRKQRADKPADGESNNSSALGDVDGTDHSKILRDLGRMKLLVRAAANQWDCSPNDVQTLELAAALHDIGNIGIPDHILNKPAKLTAGEFKSVTRHVSLGAAIVEAAKLPHSVCEIVLRHHEHWDGSGYPDGLRAKKIPRLARMLTVVDCFHALVSDRPHRPALSIEGAMELMRKQSGAIFDPELLDVFLHALPDIASRVNAEAAAIESVPDARESRLQGEPDEKNFPETPHGQSLQKLTAAPDRLVAFYEILQVLGTDLNFDKSLKNCLRILRKAVPCDRAGIFLLEQGNLVLLQGDGFPDHCVSRLIVSSEQGLIADAGRSKKPIIANTAPAVNLESRVPRYLDDIKSSLVAPLIFDERIVGSIALCSKTPQRFRAEDAELLSLITGKIAATVLSSRTLRRIYLEAETDVITGLPNARAVFRKLDTELQRARREHETVAVLFMDIDGLKAVNDSHGHGAGDRLLIEAGRVLKRSLRPYDFLGRMGGDEFVAIVPGLVKDQLETKVQALKAAIEVHPLAVGQGVKVRTSISIGAAVYPTDAGNAEELVYLSDRRMYRDKQRTRTRSESRRLTSPLRGS